MRYPNFFHPKGFFWGVCVLGDVVLTLFQWVMFSFFLNGVWFGLVSLVSPDCSLGSSCIDS